MFWIGGVWDARMNHRLVGFVGIIGLLLVAYAGAMAVGAPFFVRLFF